MAMLTDAVDDLSCGFLRDGFPRTVAQAEALDERLAAASTGLDAVILVDVPDALSVERISSRLTCPQGCDAATGDAGSGRSVATRPDALV